MLKPGNSAPDFELERLSGAESEGPVLQGLKDLTSRGPALLVFVKESCPTCLYVLPLVDRIFRNYPESKTSLVVVAQEDTRGAQKLVDDLDLHLPVLLDEEPHSVSERYGLALVPTVFYLGRDGRIESAFEGFAREELVEINEKIASLHNTAPVPFFSPEEGVPAFRPG